MAQAPNENTEALVRRLSDDFIQFKTSHNLPDDLESSIKIKILLLIFF
jgi:hypothetical protein